MAPISRTAFYDHLDRHPAKKDASKKAADTRDQGIAEEAKATIRAAFAKDWKSAAWWLERNFPDRCGMNPALRTEEQATTRPVLTEERLDELLDDDDMRKCIQESWERIEARKQAG